MRPVRYAIALALLALGACRGPEPAAERYREQALQAAYEAGQIELSCPEATPRVTAQQVTQPPGALGRRFTYTVEVAGCGGDTELLIVCTEDGAPCAPQG